MKRIILACALLLPGAALAGPRFDGVRAPMDNAVLDPGGHPDYTCNAGGPISLLTGAAMLGLIARRRRR